MRAKSICASLVISVFFISSSVAFSSTPKQPQAPEKVKIIKIRNTGEIITQEQLEKLDPKTIQSMDVYPDSVIITLKSKKAGRTCMLIRLDDINYYTNQQLPIKKS